MSDVVITGRVVDRVILQNGSPPDFLIYPASDRIRIVQSVTSANHTHDLATPASDGWMSKEDKAKLDGLDEASLLNRANHTGEQPISSITGLSEVLDQKMDETSSLRGGSF